jgi:hypothetical protein
MKKISIIAVCAIALVSVIWGCTKNVINYGDIQKITADQALLKINYGSQYANNRAVFIKINDQRISNLITGRQPYPGGGYNTGGNNTADFLQVNSGPVKVSIVLPKKIYDGLDSIVLYSTTVNIEAGKNYIMNITDTAATTANIATEEDFTKPDSLVTRYHFVNLMPNVPDIDLYYGATTATATDQSTDSLLVSNIGYLKNSADFTIKNATTTFKTFKIRPAGSAKTAATVLASYLPTTMATSRRSFLAFATGYSGKVSPSTQRPYISFLLIR